MKKVLLTMPDSIAGTLIFNGFASGFKANGCFVVQKDLRELTVSDIKKLKPDYILGYDYGFFLRGSKEVVDYLKSSENNAKLIHYFADEPNGKLAFVDKPDLYKIFYDFAKENKNVYTFLWDEGFVNSLPRAEFLPLAVNCKKYLPEEGNQYEISFVGRPLTEKRQKILAALVRRFGKKLKIFSYEKHFLQSLDDMKNLQLLSDEEMEVYKSAYCGFLTTEKELADVYFNSKVNINITLQGKSGLNYRVFEVPASGGFLLTDEMEGIADYFEPSREIETYKNLEELIDKTEFYLKNPEIAQRIAVAGFNTVRKSHSYTARARFVLDSVKA